jgi:galactose mutarotase-like enzyme
MKSPLLFQNQPAWQITDDKNKILISSDRGARVLQWKKDGREIITWPEDADWSRIMKVRGGDPILFPFVARHYVDGKNEFWRDSAGTVRPMPQHGFAKEAKFTVIEDGVENAVRMRLTDSEETRALYPFSFQFDVVVELHPESRLEVRFETTNTGADPLPYYPGHHFYFAMPHQERGDWTLHLPCASWGTRGENGEVIHEKAASDSFRLDDPAPIDRFQIGPKETTATLHNTRTGQKLVFELKHPGSVPWFVVTTWTQTPESDFYCVEPWLGLPDAIHHGEGLRWLAPGAKEIARVVLDGKGW